MPHVFETSDRPVDRTAVTESIKAKSLEVMADLIALDHVRHDPPHSRSDPETALSHKYNIRMQTVARCAL
jgi:hypothetical protein